MPHTRAALTWLTAPHPSGSAGTPAPGTPSLTPGAEDSRCQVLWPLTLLPPNSLTLGSCFLLVSVSPTRPSSRQGPRLSHLSLSPAPSTVLAHSRGSVVTCRRKEGSNEARKEGRKEGSFGQKTRCGFCSRIPHCRSGT